MSQTSLELHNEMTASRALVLMSLGTSWHEQIVDGVKHYEYRRKFLKKPTTAVVYVGEKTRAVCALASFGSPVIGSPDEIAAVAEADQPGIGPRLCRYFGNRAEVYAVPIERYEVVEPIQLAELRRKIPSFHPPQSYLYVDRNPPLLNFLAERIGVPLQKELSR